MIKTALQTYARVSAAIVFPIITASSGFTCNWFEARENISSPGLLMPTSLETRTTSKYSLASARVGVFTRYLDGEPSTRALKDSDKYSFAQRSEWT